MPIDFVYPTPAGPIGAGMIVQWQSDFVGPLPSGTIIDLTVRIPGDEVGQVWRERFPTSTPFGFVVLGTSPGQAGNVVDRFPAIASAVNLEATLGTPTTTVDSGSVSAVWQPTLGLGTQAQILSNVTGTGGFTADDRAQLAITVANTASPIGEAAPVPYTGPVPVGQLNIIPPFWLMSRSESILISGRGSVNRPSDSDHLDAAGARVFFVTVPAGFGLINGVITDFQRRIAQLAVVRVFGDGSEWASEVFDCRRSGEVLLWAGPFWSTRLEYDVAPGCTVELQWLTVPGQ